MTGTLDADSGFDDHGGFERQAGSEDTADFDTHSAFDADNWAARFMLLSDSTRLRLVAEMHAHPRSTVAELAGRIGITENAASQSIRKLRDQGWVRSQKVGRMVHYEVVSDAIVHRILHDIIGVGHGEHTDHHHPVTTD